MQGHRLAGSARLRHGSSDGAGQRWLRPGPLLRLRLRHGAGATDDAQASDRGHPYFLGKRPAFPRAILKEADMNQETPPTGELSDELRALGENLRSVFQAAWDSDDRRRLQQEIESG